jgi:CreA protein
MRLLLISLSIFLAASCAARADDFPCISTTFNLLSPDDKVCVSEYDDPVVPGVACYISQARKGGWGAALRSDRGSFQLLRFLSPSRTNYR